MTDKNLLTIFKSGDENHYLFRDFFKSLPGDTEKVLDSFGYVGSLIKNLNGFRRSNGRHFLILRSEDFGELDTRYFSTTSKARLSEIPDRLRVKVDYKQQDTDFCTGARQTINDMGTIDDMVELFNELSAKDPRKLLQEGLDKHEFLRKNMTRRKLFGKGKKVVPIYVSTGLETLDGKYLLNTTYAQGLFVGTYNEK